MEPNFGKKMSRQFNPISYEGSVQRLCMGGCLQDPKLFSAKSDHFWTLGTIVDGYIS